MSIETPTLSMKAIIRLEKYPDNVTQEEIDSGKVKPIEVIEFEEDLLLDESKINKLFKGGVI